VAVSERKEVKKETGRTMVFILTLLSSLGPQRNIKETGYGAQGNRRDIRIKKERKLSMDQPPVKEIKTRLIHSMTTVLCFCNCLTHQSSAVKRLQKKCA
jgi:hypothetical protein